MFIKGEDRPEKVLHLMVRFSTLKLLGQNSCYYNFDID